MLDTFIPLRHSASRGRQHLCSARIGAIAADHRRLEPASFDPGQEGQPGRCLPTGQAPASSAVLGPIGVLVDDRLPQPGLHRNRTASGTGRGHGDHRASALGDIGAQKPICIRCHPIIPRLHSAICRVSEPAAPRNDEAASVVDDVGAERLVWSVRCGSRRLWLGCIGAFRNRPACHGNHHIRKPGTFVSCQRTGTAAVDTA